MRKQVDESVGLTHLVDHRAPATGEALNATDSVFKKVPQADRANVVLGPVRSDADAPPAFVFDITIARG